MTPFRVLVIDDEPEIGHLVEQVLTIAGFATRYEGTGTAGLAAAADWRPHAAVVDLMLPDVDGFTLLGRLRGDATTAGVGTLILTGADGGDLAERARAAGADHFLRKPFRPDELIECLQFLCRRHPPPDGLEEFAGLD